VGGEYQGADEDERIGEDEMRCVFDEPVRAVTPGQAVVFYENDYVFGGGTIL
jgi:tRNA-specific 2-thiouridylase